MNKEYEEEQIYAEMIIKYVTDNYAVTKDEAWSILLSNPEYWADVIFKTSIAAVISEMCSEVIIQCVMDAGMMEE